jgi:membrane protease YdiL (CAAX protease family)
VFFFGFSSAFKNGGFFRGLLCGLPYLALQIFILVLFFSENLGNPEVSWKPWYLIVYGVFSVVGIGIREECIYRATLQNIVAKKYANSVKGIWISTIISAAIFGLSHVTNLFYGVEPLAVLAQVLSATMVGILFGAIYLRSGSIWAVILIHTLVDTAGLAGSTFLRSISDVDDMNQLSVSWAKLIMWLLYIGLAAFLLRPSKCKQICESLCFAGEEPEEATHE